MYRNEPYVKARRYNSKLAFNSLTNEQIHNDYIREHVRRYGPIPVPNSLTNEQIQDDYEKELASRDQRIAQEVANLVEGSSSDPRGGLTAQQLINRAYKQGGGTFNGAAEVLRAQGLNINQLVKERDIERGTPNRTYTKVASTSASSAPVKTIQKVVREITDNKQHTSTTSQAEQFVDVPNVAKDPPTTGQWVDEPYVVKYTPTAEYLAGPYTGKYGVDTASVPSYRQGGMKKKSPFLPVFYWNRGR